MSILIKGMDMPKNCTDCPCLDTQNGICQANADKEYVYSNKPSWCTLVELPPHGLIDKQMLLRNISENQFTNSYVGHEDEYAFWDKVWDYIINAPTIIEADSTQTNDSNALDVLESEE